MPVGPQVIDNVPFVLLLPGGSGSHDRATVPAFWSMTSAMFPPAVPSTRSEASGDPAPEPGGSSAWKASRFPGGVTTPRQATDAVRPLRLTGSPPSASVLWLLTSPPRT